MPRCDEVTRLCEQLVSDLEPTARQAALTRVEQALNKIDVDADLMADVLRSELAGSFFDEDHFSKNRSKRSLYNVQQVDAACQVLGALFPSRRFEGPGLLPQLPSAEADAAQDHLNENGYVVLPNRLDEASCAAITRGLNDVDFRVKATGETVRGYRKEDANKISGNTCWVVDQQSVLQLPEVQRLASDPTILNLIQGYLGCVPIHDQVNCWWTINHKTSSKSMKSDAQLYHQDRDYLRFVKVFVYLNDVTNENGPHEYISGSARDYEQNVPAGYSMGQRVNDQHLRGQYAAERFVSFTGERGTIVLEDTGGFHKGTPVVRGHRLLLQLEYCCSLYMRPGTSFGFEGLTPEYTQLAEEHPRMFLNYDNERYLQDAAKRRRQLSADANKLNKRLRRLGSKLSWLPGLGGSKKSAA